MKNKNLTPTPSESTAANKKIVGVRLPCGSLCGHNCADGCIYWCPRERQGCLSFDDGE